MSCLSFIKSKQVSYLRILLYNTRLRQPPQHAEPASYRESVSVHHSKQRQVTSAITVTVMNATTVLPNLTEVKSLTMESLDSDPFIVSDALNVTSAVNSTAWPNYFVDMETKRIVVIATNIIVFLSIVFTCVLAFSHKRWEDNMRRRMEQHTDSKFDYAPINVKEKDDSRVEGGLEEDEDEDEVVFEL